MATTRSPSKRHRSGDDADSATYLNQVLLHVLKGPLTCGHVAFSAVFGAEGLPELVDTLAEQIRSAEARIKCPGFVSSVWKHRTGIIERKEQLTSETEKFSKSLDTAMYGAAALGSSLGALDTHKWLTSFAFGLIADGNEKRSSALSAEMVALKDPIAEAKGDGFGKFALLRQVSCADMHWLGRVILAILMSVSGIFLACMSVQCLMFNVWWMFACVCATRRRVSGPKWFFGM